MYRTIKTFTLFGILLFILSACSNHTSSVISGSVLGSNHEVLTRADIHLTLLGQNQAPVHVRTDSAGHFNITAKKTGVYRIQFTGTNHRMLETILNLKKPADLKMNILLPTNYTNPNMKRVYVIGAFNHFSYADAIEMQLQPDGTYTATVPADSSILAYQIIGPDPDNPVNGTQSNAYSYDGNGSYVSIIDNVSGNVRITFDPSKLDKQDMASALTFTHAPTNIIRFSNAYQSYMSQKNKYWKAYEDYRASGKDPNNFNYDWTSDLASVSTKLKNEKDADVRKLLLLSYLDAGLYGSMNIRQDIAREALKQISATSPLWSIQPMDMLVAVDESGQPDKYTGYLKSAADNHTDHDVKATVLYYQLTRAYHSGNLKKAQDIYTELTNKYNDTNYAQWAKQMFSVNQAVVIGKKVPDFKVTSLRNSKITYSRKNMLGKNYMIDFWATWCGPCVREMPNITAAYKKYKNKNFTVLSLSLDDSLQDVIRFHKNRYAMPWNNAFLGGGFQNKLAKEFDVDAIPSPILVNAKGVVVAKGIDLRGDNLDMTLAHYLK